MELLIIAVIFAGLLTISLLCPRATKERQLIVSIKANIKAFEKAMLQIDKQIKQFNKEIEGLYKDIGNAEHKRLMRTVNYYITHRVDCLYCGKLYIPIKVPYLVRLGVPPIMANNYCSRKCWEKASLEGAI